MKLALTSSEIIIKRVDLGRCNRAKSYPSIYPTPGLTNNPAIVVQFWKRGTGHETTLIVEHLMRA